MAVNLVFLVFVTVLASAATFSFRGSPPYGVDITQDTFQNKEFNLISDRIVGGNEALDEQFPYQVGFFLYSENGTSLCGGSLIGRRWVLTAAHCLRGRDSARVFLGTHNILISNEVGRQVIDVPKSNFIIHPNYDSLNTENDIALVRLTVDARISRNIQIISLPVSNSDDSFVGVTAVASGWGRTSDDSTAVSPVLRFVDVEVIPNNECALYFGIGSSNICTSGLTYKSPCNGDSGGPLVYVRDKTKILIGLTSFGSSRGCEKRYPAVFTRVTYYLDWIKNTTGM